MSDTYKTRPYEVQATDNLIAVHDHSNGECNLPTVKEFIQNRTRPRWHRHDCYYECKNWHTDVSFSRYKGDKDWIAESKTRKYRDWKDNYDY